MTTPPRPPTHGVPSTSQTVVEAMRDLKNCSWYWGPIGWEVSCHVHNNSYVNQQAAERVLQCYPPGTFLLRDSASDRYVFTISVKTDDGVKHARVPQHHGQFTFGSPNNILHETNMVNFVQKVLLQNRSGSVDFLMHPRNGIDQSVHVTILHPISRNSLMPSLKHLCRFCVLQLVRRDKLDILPLPQHVIEYLKNPCYVAETTEQKLNGF